MAARLSIWSTCRALAVRSRPIVVSRSKPSGTSVAYRRWYADESKGAKVPPQTPTELENTDTSQIVPPSELGSLEPSEQPGLRGAKEALEAETGAPVDALGDEALEGLLYGTRAPPKDSDPGLTKAQEESLYQEGMIPTPQEAEEKFGEEVRHQEEVEHAVVANAAPALEHEPPESGLKFAPPKPLSGEGYHLKRRYHPVLEQITRLLMRDGKLSVAQRNMAMVMNFLRTSPEPTYSPKFPLLPGTPPATHLPLNPILYLTIAIDSVAPLMRIRNIAGGAGGGRALEMPVPLALRQRRRVAFQWIMDVVEKKPSKGSGRKQFPHRLAEEIIAVVEGRSSVWEKRKQVHKLGTAARANLNKMSKRKNRK
ncbi:ribosomal protein S7 [Sarocladium strictum]